jgi:hypothetical protein
MALEESLAFPESSEIPDSFVARVLRSTIPLGSEAVSVSSAARHTPVARGALA